MIEFRNQLIDYLRREKELTEAEIARHRTLSDEAKEEAGLMIRHASIDISDDEVLTNEYRFRFDDNQTKIRIGDKVKLICENTDVAVRKLVTVLEVSPTYIVLETGSDLGLDENSLWSIEVLEVSMFESFIKVIEKIEEGQPGSSFISQLAGEELPEDDGGRRDDRCPECDLELDRKRVECIEELQVDRAVVAYGQKVRDG